MKYDVFISYSRKDFDEVSGILQSIKDAIPDISCWFDIDGIESGDEFEDKIITAIDNSSYVLFALSENSIGSKWTKDEVMYARNMDKKVIPVLLKGAQMKGWFLFKFGRVDCIDSTNALQMEKLLQNLSDWTGKNRTIETAADPVVQSEPEPLCPCGSGKLFKECHGKSLNINSEQNVREDNSASIHEDKFDEVLNSFLGSKDKPKEEVKNDNTEKQRYDILENDEGQIMLIIHARAGEPQNPLFLISDTYSPYALLYRNKECAVYFEDFDEHPHSSICKLEQIWVVEITDDDMVREYKCPVRKVKDVRVFM